MLVGDIFELYVLFMTVLGAQADI